ncbi:MAG: hypothetical protein V3W41_14305 [Planctomycetota bacterium]
MQGFDIGNVLSKSFSCFARHWTRFVLLVAIVMLPVLIANLFLISSLQEIEQMQELDPNDQQAAKEAMMFLLSFMGIMCGVIFLNICLQSLATASLVYGTFKDMRGQPVIIRECLGIALKRLPMLILLSFVVGIVVAFGALFCCVPGIIAWVFFYLVIPAAVVENSGLGSFGRSIELVKGSFWPILAIGLIFVIGIGMIGSGVTSQIFALIDDRLGVIIGWLTGIFATTIIGISQAVSYHDIRAAKEGLVDEDIAAIFD